MLVWRRCQRLLEEFRRGKEGYDTYLDAAGAVHVGAGAGLELCRGGGDGEDGEDGGELHCAGLEDAEIAKEFRSEELRSADEMLVRRYLWRETHGPFIDLLPKQDNLLNYTPLASSPSIGESKHPSNPPRRPPIPFHGTAWCNETRVSAVSPQLSCLRARSPSSPTIPNMPPAPLCLAD
jgi:hypothetical protein